MGRIFEKRKHKMFARWSKMAKAFTKVGKDIAIAVKQGGGDPATNAKLRTAVQNAKSLNMPKDRIESAIKRASSKEQENYEEIIYEGYAPHGVALVIECATDNPIRTVANIRMYFSRGNGTLGKTGSLGFLFERKGVFKISAQGHHLEELELDLIDYGADEIQEDEGFVFIYTPFSEFGKMQKALEEKGIEIINAALQRIPVSFKEVSAEQEEEVNKLIEMIEEDDDVQAVYNNMK